MVSALGNFPPFEFSIQLLEGLCDCTYKHRLAELDTQPLLGFHLVKISPHKCRAIDGFKEWPLMEDVDLVLRLRRAYGPPSIAAAPMRVSARRWLKLGYVRTTIVNWSLLLRWMLGAEPNVLASTYYGRSIGKT